MPRRKRSIVPGLPHHLTHRGNRRQGVYRDEEDREVYLDLLGNLCTREAVNLFGYCLMTNHVHLILTPPEHESLGRLMRDLLGTYAYYFNRKYKLTGHLWQGRFFSCVLDEEHFWTAMRYVERNPIRAGLVKKPGAYRWSSASAHCGIRTDELLAPLPFSGSFVTNWSEWLCMEEQKAENQVLRLATRTGRPCGSEAFVVELERRLGCRLRPRKGGRPKKQQKTR